MSKKQDIHVVPHKAEGWATKKEGAERVSSTHRTQNAAINRAVGEAKKEGLEVVIHRKDGTIRDSDSYGNDPNPPKEKTLKKKYGGLLNSDPLHFIERYRI